MCGHDPASKFILKRGSCLRCDILEDLNLLPFILLLFTYRYINVANCLTNIYYASLKIANLHDFPIGNFQKMLVFLTFQLGLQFLHTYRTGCPVASQAKSQTPVSPLFKILDRPLICNIIILTYYIIIDEINAN